MKNKAIPCLIIVMIIALCGCSKNDLKKDETEHITSSETQTVTTTTNETTSKNESTTTLSTTKKAETTSKKESFEKATNKNNNSKTSKETTTKPKKDSSNTSSNKDNSSENKDSSSSNSSSSSSGTHQHTMSTGNIGKWFDSRSELENYVSSVIKEWNEKLANQEITLDEYNKNAPTGYEAWSCSTCGKWTGNFKYR